MVTVRLPNVPPHGSSDWPKLANFIAPSECDCPPLNNATERLALR
ncbi:MAG: hypothetical protein ACTS4X_01335 [Candidatus Hodgkinia cicadicola]